MSTPTSTCGRYALLLLPFLLIRSAHSQTIPHWRVTAWQRVTSQQKRTMIRFATGQKSQKFIQVVRSTSQFRAVLDLEKESTSADGRIRWKGVLGSLQLVDDEGEPFPDVSPDMQRKIRAHKAAEAAGICRVLQHLSGAHLNVVQKSDGQIVSIDVSGFRPAMKTALKTVSDKNRRNVEIELQSVLDAQQWQHWLSVQAPTVPSSHNVGDTWNYAPTLLVPYIKPTGGTTRIESVQGEGDTAQTRVTSTLTVNINGQPDLTPDSAQYVLDYHSTVRAQTLFGAQTAWPMEHSATERGNSLFKIFVVDKQKHIGLADATPDDFQIELRLISQAIDTLLTP